MPDWAAVALLITALGGLGTGIAGLITARKSARKTEVEALALTVEALQAENARLRECIAEVKRENKALRVRISALEQENKRLRESLVDEMRVTG